MSISWKGIYAYAFPPFVMLGRVLEKILTDHPCELILIAPKWPNQCWYARLLELLVDFPLVLPLRKDMLTQPHNHLRHQSLQAVRLHAWRLSSDPSKRKDFLTQLPSKLQTCARSVFFRICYGFQTRIRKYGFVNLRKRSSPKYGNAHEVMVT